MNKSNNPIYLVYNYDTKGNYEWQIVLADQDVRLTRAENFSAKQSSHPLNIVKLCPSGMSHMMSLEDMLRELNGV